MNKFSKRVTYRTIRCSDFTEQECVECAYLFSTCYGKYCGKDDPEKKGELIKLSPKRYYALRQKDDMYVSLCQDQGIIIGSCFFLKKEICQWASLCLDYSTCSA